MSGKFSSFSQSKSSDSQFQKLSASEGGKGGVGPVSKSSFVSDTGVEKTVEESLLNTAYWALFAIRVPGYFPLSLSHSDTSGYRLNLSFWTLPTFYTIVIGIFSLVGNAYFIKTYYEAIMSNDSLANYENTTSILWTGMLILVIHTTGLRCSRIYYARRSLKFWKLTVVTVERIYFNGYKINDSYLRKVSDKIFLFTILCHFVSFIRVIYNSYSIYKDMTNPCSSYGDWATSFLELFLTFTLCFHVGYSIWLIFLINIFTVCFQLIHDDLDSIYYGSKKFSDGDDDVMNVRRGLDDPPPPSIPSFVSLLGMDYRERMNYEQEEVTSKDDAKEIEHMIKKTVATYELIEDHMHKFSNQFGWSLVIETFFVFVYIVMCVYCLETFLKIDFVYAAVQVIPALIYTASLYNLASDSSILSGKAVGTLKKLEKFFVPNDMPQLQTLQLKVLSLIARVADNPPTINAAHFFKMDRHLLTAFVGTVTTYLVVLLQFKVTPKPPEVIGCLANETLTSCGICEPISLLED